MKVAEFLRWVMGYRRPTEILVKDDGRSYVRQVPFNHLDVLGVDVVKALPPPAPVPDFGELTPETKRLESVLFDTLNPIEKQRVHLAGQSSLVTIDYESFDIDRPAWPQTWMSVARSIAQRSYDPRLRVGAIVVSEDNTRVLSVGYNGNYRGGPNEAESLEPGKSGMIHAEQNALVKCDFNFPKKKHMYLTHSPCRACAKLIINAEISRVIYNEIYRDPSGIELLKTAGVEVYSLEEAILKAKS